MSWYLTEDEIKKIENIQTPPLTADQLKIWKTKYKKEKEIFEKIQSVKQNLFNQQYDSGEGMYN